MEPWWERWPDRLAQERDAFAAHGFEMELDEDLWSQGRAVFRGRVAMRGQVLDLKIEYPDDFPATRFQASTKAVQLPRHQAPGGSLCLLGRGSDQWRREWTAADVIAEQLPLVLDTTRLTAEAMRALEDPQGEPYSAYYPYIDTGSILVPDDLRTAAEAAESGSMTVRMLRPGPWPAAKASADPVGQGTLLAITDESGKEATTIAPHGDRCRGDTWRGSWMRVENPPDAQCSPAELVDRVGKAGGRLDFKRHGSSGLERAILGVVFQEEVRQGEYGDAWMFLVITRPASARDGGPTRARRSTSDRRVGIVRGLRVGPASNGERIPEVAALRQMTVALIGAGTLGAPIARELAKAQLGDLVIVEPDFADAGPMVRWDLGLRSVGMRKGKALQEEFRVEYPFTHTDVVEVSVGNTFTGRGPGAQDHLVGALYGADLIIDATAEWNIREVVAAYADEIDVPLITVWSIEGYGGVVSVRRSGEEPCYYCRELWISPESGVIDLPTGPPDPLRIQPTGCADPTFTATSPDLRPLADQAVRVAFGLLTQGRPVHYPMSARDLYIYWHRRPDGSLYDPPRWTSEDLPRHPECVCNDAA